MPSIDNRDGTMNLSDLYQKETAPESRKFEVIRSDGTPSGHHITLINPSSAKAASVAFMFDSALNRRMKKYEEEKKALREECEAAANFSEYNIGFEMACQDLRDAFAMEVVDGWDFDNEFTPEALKAAIDGYRSPVLFSLQRQIINAYRDMVEAQAKK